MRVRLAGERVKERREELGFTKTFLAEQSDVTPSTIRRIERADIYSSNLLTAKAIASALRLRSTHPLEAG